MKDFFVSYNSADKTWAAWIAWILEEQGYSVVIQAWDFRPGGNFVLDMQRATAESRRTIMVLSENYLKASYTQPEWAAAFKQDPQSTERLLLPIRVGECKPTGLLGPLVYVDIVNKGEAEAEQLVLDALKDRAKPTIRPAFPGDASTENERVTSAKVSFPGSPTPSQAALSPDAPSPVEQTTAQTTNPTVNPHPTQAPTMNPSATNSAKTSLSPRERLALSRKITGLTVQEFNDLVLLLGPPQGLIPPPSTQQGDRTYALLNWAQSTTGCGLVEVQNSLNEILP